MGSLSTKQRVSLGAITSYSQWFVAFSFLVLGQLSNTVLRMHFCECAPLKSHYICEKPRWVWPPWQKRASGNCPIHHNYTYWAALRKTWGERAPFLTWYRSGEWEDWNWTEIPLEEIEGLGMFEAVPVKVTTRFSMVLGHCMGIISIASIRCSWLIPHQPFTASLYPSQAFFKTI